MPRKVSKKIQEIQPDIGAWKAAASAAEVILSHPLLVFVTLFSAFISVGAAVWLPNAELLKTIFASPSLGSGQKISFLLEMYQILFRTVGILQIALIVLCAVLIGMVASLSLVVMRRQRQKRIEHGPASVAVFVGLSGTGISLTGMLLLTPILTRAGLAVGLNDHVIGTLLTLTGSLVLGWATVLLGRCSFRP